TASPVRTLLRSTAGGICWCSVLLRRARRLRSKSRPGRFRSPPYCRSADDDRTFPRERPRQAFPRERCLPATQDDRIAAFTFASVAASIWLTPWSRLACSAACLRISSSLSPWATIPQPGNRSPHRRYLSMVSSSLSFGSGHGQDLLARELHRVSVTRVLLRLRHQRVFIARPHHHAARTFDDLAHRASLDRGLSRHVRYCPARLARRLPSLWRKLGRPRCDST